MLTRNKQKQSQTVAGKTVYVIVNPLKRRQIAKRKAAAETLKGIWADKDDSFFSKR